MFNLSRLLNTKIGQIFISVLLGLGLATLFRKVCKDNTCITFNGPVISEVDGKTYKFGDYCYHYELFPTKCDPMRKTVEIDEYTAKALVNSKDTKEKSSFSFF
jgi:hypothetical protein